MRKPHLGQSNLISTVLWLIQADKKIVKNYARLFQSLLNWLIGIKYDQNFASIKFRILIYMG